MAGGLIREAVSDLAETLRRVFQDPPAHAVAMPIQRPGRGGVPLLEATALAPEHAFQAAAAGEPALAAGAALAESFQFVAALQAEDAWATWSAGAQVIQPPLFEAGGCARLEVPALPRKVPARREAPEAFRTGVRTGWEPLRPGAGLGHRPTLEAPRTFRALDLALGLPVAFAPEDLKAVPKALWMRYTLALVRGTGENIRNLEVLGLYRIPARGTLQVAPQPGTGKLLVTLGPEAAGAARAPFMMARKKDDGSIVCCFVEES